MWASLLGKRLSTTLPRLPFASAKIDRAVVDEQGDGFLRIYHERGRLRGATIVGPSAGELIGTITCAM